jgi:parallel beta-helix repeat protein
MTSNLHTTLLALTLAVGALAPQAARAQACGDTLIADTVLTAPLTCAGDALAIGADDILLDCNGFSLSGDGTGIGVLLDGVTGVRVRNCFVDRFAVGILLTASSANHLTLNGVTGSTSIGNGGIQLSAGSDGNVVEANRSWANTGRGFAITDSTGNLVQDNGSAFNGFRGFDVIDASGNALLHNFAFDNTSGGVVVSGTSAGNILHANTVTDSGSEGFALFSATNFLSFNVSDDNGTWGINDSTGGANLTLLDTCAGNVSGTSSPAGMCL